MRLMIDSNTLAIQSEFTRDQIIQGDSSPLFDPTSRFSGTVLHILQNNYYGNIHLEEGNEYLVASSPFTKADSYRWRLSSRSESLLRDNTGVIPQVAHVGVMMSMNEYMRSYHFQDGRIRSLVTHFFNSLSEVFEEEGPLDGEEKAVLTLDSVAPWGCYFLTAMKEIYTPKKVLANRFFRTYETINERSLERITLDHVALLAHIGINMRPENPLPSFPQTTKLT
jgi:hypothetical protein